IDGYEITYTPASESKMYVDEISAFILLPYPEDYVPEPVIPESDDYLVGLNVCSLWRTGTHYGWDEIASYPEIKPVLGYYDEGTPETSDWEIKMMAEHGIDYEVFCWYADADTNKPIFRTTMNEALIDGYFNARYSDKIKFAIMWENTSIDCKSWEAWTDYFVPYWIEYFFLDDRYIKIDNKPLLTIWSLDAMGKAFGEKSAKEALDYLREECKKVGFDGCMIMLYSSDHTASYAANAKNSGIDCIGAYHYGTNGAYLDKHLASLESLKNETSIDRIPAVSVGFDYVGWGQSTKRNGLMDPANYPTITSYIKDEILSKRAPDSVFSKMVLISTWNEYGEGTYVMPTARHGFAYLDGVRAAFTNGGDHTDVTPNAAQKQRINYLFDQERQWLRPQLLAKSEKTEELDPYAGAVEVKKITFEDSKPENWITYNNTTVDVVDGILTLTTTGKDPALLPKSSICNIPTTDANAVVIRARVYGNQTAGSMELFFKTNDGKEYSADKFKNHKLTLGEWKDYYFDFRKVASWKGNITNLRIEPANFAFDKAEIESITFVKLPEIVEVIPFTVDINGAEMPLIKEADTSTGGLMIPLYPGEGDPSGYGVLARMKANYFWDKNTKELTIYTNKHTVKLFIGTDKIVIDGVEGKTYAETYMYDGLPVVPFDTIAEALGYFVVWHEDG
ncbi:MAG: glycoside hydrolase family 99-like domain-containing protein, partial [Clostridia bacterium]|nr:glycoside hydrolase family 99-like domain-containing protein [Clostridia bacterium]